MKYALLLAIIAWVSIKPMYAQVTITYDPLKSSNPTLCPLETLLVTVGITEPTGDNGDNGYFPAGGPYSFTLTLSGGLIFLNNPDASFTAGKNITATSVVLSDDKKTLTYAVTVFGGNRHDAITISGIQVKAITGVSSTEHLYVNHGALYALPVQDDYPIIITPPTLGLSLLHPGTTHYCTKTPIWFVVTDNSVCTNSNYNIELWGQTSDSQGAVLLTSAPASTPNPIILTTNRIDGNFSSVFAVTRYDDWFGPSTYMFIGNDKAFSINSPTLFPFTAKSPASVNRNDGLVPISKFMDSIPSAWTTVYKAGEYTSGSSKSDTIHASFFNNDQGVIVHNPVGAGTTVSDDFAKIFFDPTKVTNQNSTKIYAVTRQYFSNMSGFCTSSDSLTIDIANETINVPSFLCASDTSDLIPIQLNPPDLGSPYIPAGATFYKFYIYENGHKIDSLNDNTLSGQEPYNFDLDLRKYKVDKGMTAKLLMLKSILKYPSTKCTPFNWWWYNYGWWPGYGGMPESPLYTCVTETLYMEQASKLITIYGPPNDVKFEGLAYTTCPSQTPIRLFSNYRIDSVSVRNPGVTKVNSDWYYNPYNAFGFDFYNHYSGIKKDSLILYYIHHDFCQDKYDQPIVINPEYKVDTTVALQGFSSYPKVNGFPMVCRSNNITDGVKLSLSSIFYPLITIDRIFVNNDPGNQVIGGHLDSPPPWYFNPAYINYDRGKDTMLNIFYQYFDGIGCPWKKTMQVMVYDTLRPNFTYANICNGDTTTFNNTYTAIGNVSRDSTITWDFGDYTPTTNSNKTKHFYREPGKYPLKMTITSNVGCISRMDSTIIYGDRTNVDFYVKNHVANTGDPNAQITFYNQTVAAKTATSDTIAVAKYTWDFGDNLAGPPIYSPKFIYAYPKAGLYHVKLTAIMENGCTESDTIPIPIFPFVFVTNQTPRLYDFEDGPDGWLASNSFKRGHNSTWAYDTIGYSLADSVRWELDRAWRTSSLDTAPQVAWVESPCFNIDSLRYPMLTMDMFESVEKGLDGVTVQYTDNDGITWSTLGEVNHNVAWYDCEQILSKPAAPKDTATLSDPAFGWSKNMAHWQNVRYPLEDVIEKINADKHPFPCVRFRVKYTTNGSNPPNTTFKGFAFDNFDVTWRKNILLVEQFTNTAFDPTDEKNEFAWLDAFLSAYRDGAVAINYHPWIKNTEDTLFGINRADISARASEYGILFSPKTILDGYYESGTPANQASDTINRYAASVSLRDPGFDIHDVGIQQAGDSLVISAGITKLKAQLTPIKETTTGAHYSQDCVVRMAIVQKEMPLNGIDYKNVLIELLPNGEGNTVATIPESVPVGADMEVTSAWKPAVTTVGNHFRLIVYVQGKAGLSLVQQVWYKDIPDALVPQVTIVPSVKSVNSKSSGSVKVYPSPVSDILYVKFDEKAPARTQWQMVNMAGLVVLNGQLEADTQLFRINVYSLSDGVYLFKTIDADNGAIKTYKVLVQKN